MIFTAVLFVNNRLWIQRVKWGFALQISSEAVSTSSQPFLPGRGDKEGMNRGDLSKKVHLAQSALSLIMEVYRGKLLPFHSRGLYL